MLFYSIRENVVKTCTLTFCVCNKPLQLPRYFETGIVFSQRVKVFERFTFSPIA